MILGMLEYFRALVAEDETLPLTETALSIAQDVYPDLDLQATLAEIDALVMRLKRRLPADAGMIQKMQLLNVFFFHELGFSSNLNNYYLAENNYLNIVLHKRKGTSLLLAVLYLEMAGQIGLRVQGVSFPGHFLLRLSMLSGEIIIEPMSGKALSQAKLVQMLEPYMQDNRDEKSALNALHALLHPAPHREIIANLLRNLKMIYLQNEQWQQLLAVQHRLVILLPHDIEEKRDRGFAFMQLDDFLSALEDLQSYLEQRPDAADAAMIEQQLTKLRERAARGDSDEGER